MFGGNPDLGYAPFATDHDTFKMTSDLISMRKTHHALTRGTVTPVWSTTVAGARRDAGILAFERVAPDETALVVLNSGAVASETCAPVSEGGACLKTSLPAGTTLKDVMPGSDGKTFVVKADGTVDVTVGPRTGRVLVQ